MCVIAKERFDEEEDCDKTVDDDPGIIKTDEEFFEEIRKEYNENMCSFWRRNFSLKPLRQIRLLFVRPPTQPQFHILMIREQYTPTIRPEIVPLDDSTLQEVFRAYNNPDTVATADSWITWVFRLRQRD